MLFYMVVGLIDVEYGNIYFDDYELIYKFMYVRVQMGIGYLLQEVLVFCKLIVVENILVIL